MTKQNGVETHLLHRDGLFELIRDGLAIVASIDWTQGLRRQPEGLRLSTWWLTMSEGKREEMERSGADEVVSITSSSSFGHGLDRWKRETHR